MQEPTSKLIAGNGPKWFNSLATAINGSIKDIQKLVPDFEKRTFSLGGSSPSRKRKRLHCSDEKTR